MATPSPGPIRSGTHGWRGVRIDGSGAACRSVGVPSDRARTPRSRNITLTCSVSDAVVVESAGNSAMAGVIAVWRSALRVAPHALACPACNCASATINAASSPVASGVFDVGPVVDLLVDEVLTDPAEARPSDIDGRHAGSAPETKSMPFPPSRSATLNASCVVKYQTPLYSRGELLDPSIAYTNDCGTSAARLAAAANCPSSSSTRACPIRDRLTCSIPFGSPFATESASAIVSAAAKSRIARAYMESVVSGCPYVILPFGAIESNGMPEQ